MTANGRYCCCAEPQLNYYSKIKSHIMKLNFIRPLGIAAILLLCAVFCQGQDYQLLGFSIRMDCGTWKDSVYYSEWTSVDTIGKRAINDKREWVYNKEDESLNNNNLTTLVYCPCGCRYDSHWYQYRICRLTGIRQRRTKVQTWLYTPPPSKPKTEYEKVVDSLKSHK